MSTAPLRFQGWELRPTERALLVKGVPVPMGGRAFDILQVLAERDGQLVTKEELLQAVWPGLVVEENNISVHIAALRKVLGGGVIATVAGRGYRLSAARAAGRDPTEVHELLGRDQEAEELRRAFESSRLTSIVGAGGVGKTAMARALVARLHAAETIWIDLSPITDSRLVAPLLAKGFAIDVSGTADPLAALQPVLRHRNAIVVLDNCENLLAETARCVEHILAGAPGIRWLVTSQAPLHVPSERVFRLEPLAVPPVGLSAARALDYGAIALLCQRLARADSRFRLDDDNVEAVTVVCAHLDGIPLAIEMAAARAATFGLDEVRRHLAHRLKMFSGPRDAAARHRTLEATYEWSYGLLSEAQQNVFRRLESFVGGFTTDRADEVASEAGEAGHRVWETLDALDALVDKSLVHRVDGAPGRFQLLETGREYARGRLEAAGEALAVRRRHSQAFAAFYGRAQSDAEQMKDAEWTQRYAPDRDNARAALVYAAVTGEADDLARLVTAMAMMDSFLCRQSEVLQLDIPLALLAKATPELRASAYLELSWQHYMDGDRVLGTQLAQDAFELFNAQGQPARAYRALAQLTRLYESRPGLAPQAQACWERLQQMDDRQLPLRIRLFCNISCGLLHRAGFTAERMQVFGRLAAGAGFEAMAALSVCNVTDKMLIAGRAEDAVAVALRLMPSRTTLPRAHAIVEHNLALALIRLGRVQEAHGHARSAYRSMPGIAHFLVDAFALVAAREGRYTDAAVLHGCGSSARRARDEQPDHSEAAAIAETASLLQQGLSDAECQELCRIGEAMSPAEALTIKVFASPPPASATAAASTGFPGRSSSLDFA